MLGFNLSGLGRLRSGFRTDVMVLTEERSPLRLNVQPTAAGCRRRPRVGDPRREAVRWKVNLSWK